MTKGEITFNYNQAMKQARKLDEIAGKLSRLSSSKLESTIGALKNAWQSDNSSRYYQKAGKVQEDIRVTANDIKKIAQGIRVTAEAIRRAELQALEIASSRSYI